MDPLSLTIGAVTLVGVCHKIVQGLQILEGLSQVPDDIAALIDELSDLESVLVTVCGIEQRTKSLREDKETTDDLKALLLKASHIIIAIARHCGIALEEEKYCAGDTASVVSSQNTKVDLLTKFRWLKDQKKITGFRDRLKVVRLDISNHLASRNLHNTYSILSEVRDLAEVCRRLSIEKDEIITTSQAVMAVKNSTPAAEKETTFSDSRQHPVKEMSSCSCACHRVSTFHTPRATEQWIGHLQVRSGGLPYLTPACDQVLCRQRMHATLQTSYRLPAWLSNRVYNSKLTTNNMVGPDLNLFSTRVISRNSQIFYYAMEGNITGIKKLFSEGTASPYDCTHNYGYSALHYAADYGHLELCNFLIKAGAKPELQDFDNRTPTDLAYRKLVTEGSSQQWDGDRVQEIFDQDEWLEQRQLTMLHKIVLGIAGAHVTLAAELSKSVKEIDSGDCDLRTPLSWAAELGIDDAVRTLLKFGASISKVDCHGNTPVHYACKTTSGPLVLSILMDAGANALARNKWQQTPLNWVSYHQTDRAYAERLLMHPGVRNSLKNDVDQWGSTPAGNTVWNGNAVILAFLLDNGVDPNGAVGCGEAPILDCIGVNGHECLEILCSRARECHLNISRLDDRNEGCLHIMARLADVKTIKIFHEAILNDHIDISELRTAAVGKEGLTARNILALRGDADIQIALEQILSLVDIETMAERSSVSSEGVEYVDAFDMLQDLEKEIGLKSQPLVQVREIMV